MAAVSGANGSVLWERPMVQDVVLVECTMLQPSDSKTSSACILVGRPGSFLAIDLLTGRGSHYGGVSPECCLKGGQLNRDLSGFSPE